MCHAKRCSRSCATLPTGTFNTLNVDGATSTNDTVILLANGRNGKPDLNEFADAVHKCVKS